MGVAGGKRGGPSRLKSLQDELNLRGVDLFTLDPVMQFEKSVDFAPRQLVLRCQPAMIWSLPPGGLMS